MTYSRLLTISLLGFFLLNNSNAAETIVMLRHGEKPDGGLGQLSCQGLNRALALPAVLQKKFDKPVAIFATNPGIQKYDGLQRYYYVRPLATIEPTAIALNLPVNTEFGWEDTDQLQAALLAPAYQNATVFVVWEHRMLERTARKLLADNGGDPAQVPNWKGSDFDGIYVITISTDTSTGKPSASFHHDNEALNQLPTTCPSYQDALQRR